MGAIAGAASARVVTKTDQTGLKADHSRVPAASTNIPDRTHESGAALTAVPFLFPLLGSIAECVR